MLPVAFRDDGSGKYYVVTNLQQTLDSNPELSHSIHLSNFEGNNYQYRMIGVFTYGPPVNYEDADVM
jgi:hypothetical protein